MKVDNVGSNVSTSPAPADLVDYITGLLVQAGHPSPQAWMSDLHADAIGNTDQNIQRFLINRAWRNILGRMQVENDAESTLDVRYCLVETGDIGRWCDLFKEGVLPCIMSHSQAPGQN